MRADPIAGDTAANAVLADPRTFAREVPHAHFARLRREHPVAWVTEAHRMPDTGTAATAPGYWAVTRHASVIAASRDTDTFSSGLRGAFLRDAEGGRYLLVNMDGARHRRLRGQLTPLFTGRSMRLLGAGIEEHVTALVSRVLAAETFDVVADLAAELPLLVLCDLLGIPRGDRHLLLRWSNNLVGFDDPDYGGVETYRRTFGEIFDYALDVLADRRARPRDDLISQVVGAETGGRPVNDSEFCALWLLLVVAGNETTRHLISGGLQVLAGCPGERDRLVADPGLTETAVDELLRWLTPIMQFRRTATRDTVLDGQPIKEGDRVVLYFVSANRDETVFTEPARLDLGRTPNPHLAFGIGSHYCLGAHLARLEMAIVLDALRPHLDRFEIIGPAVRLESNFMNGLKSLPARFRRAGRPGGGP